MATINAVALTKETITTAAFTATAPGGDVLAIGNTNADVIIEFENTAAGAVVPTIVNNVAASLDVGAYGKVEKADLSASIAAGGSRAILIPRAQLGLYLNGSNQIPLTYTSHDVLFKVRALYIA